MPEAALQIALAVDDRTPDWERCVKVLDRDVTPEDLCHLGPKNGAAPRFLVWGDSHALALFPAVDAAATETGIVGLHASLYQCPPVPGIDVNASGIDCSGFNRRISDLIDSEQFEVVILAAHWSNYLEPTLVRLPDGFAVGRSSEFFREKLEASIQRLTSKGIAVFVVDEVPYTKNFRPEQFARAVWWGRSTDEARITVADYESRLQPFWSALNGSRFERISLVKYLCVDGSFCPAIMDGWSNYFDDNHLSTHGSTRLTPAFVDALQGIRSK
ncbi:MAG: SGNH hydrolase domain-containing protein [Proteobacteria bacterium]|nr:SGNH hydrolase domain-containing protein [Pseudomonadota bacterium]